METLRIRTFADHRERILEVIEHRSSGILLLQEQGDDKKWLFDPPLSVVPHLSDAIRDRGLKSAVGLTITGHMPGHISTMRWIVK